MPETTYRVVHKAIKEQGGYLSVGKNTLLKLLAQEGLLEPAKDKETTRFKKINGKSQRVIFMPRQQIIGEVTERSH